MVVTVLHEGVYVEIRVKGCSVIKSQVGRAVYNIKGK